MWSGKENAAKISWEKNKFPTNYHKTPWELDPECTVEVTWPTEPNISNRVLFAFNPDLASVTATNIYIAYNTRTYITGLGT